VILTQLNLTKLKLEFLKSDFAKNKHIYTHENFTASLKFDFFQVQLKFTFIIRILISVTLIFIRTILYKNTRLTFAQNLRTN